MAVGATIDGTLGTAGTIITDRTGGTAEIRIESFITDAASHAVDAVLAGTVTRAITTGCAIGAIKAGEAIAAIGIRIKTFAAKTITAAIDIVIAGAIEAAIRASRTRWTIVTGLTRRAGEVGAIDRITIHFSRAIFYFAKMLTRRAKGSGRASAFTRAEYSVVAGSLIFTHRAARTILAIKSGFTCCTLSVGAI